MAQSNDWGKIGERLAMEFLVTQGYTIRETGYRTGPKKKIEIDIIAQKGNEISFVEVKTRSSEDVDPVDAVDRDKRCRMVRAADIYLSSLQHTFDWTFDIIAVTGTPENYRLDYLHDAFFPELL